MRTMLLITTLMLAIPAAAAAQDERAESETTPAAVDQVDVDARGEALRLAVLEMAGVDEPPTRTEQARSSRRSTREPSARAPRPGTPSTRCSGATGRRAGRR